MYQLLQLMCDFPQHWTGKYKKNPPLVQNTSESTISLKLHKVLYFCCKTKKEKEFKESNKTLKSVIHDSTEMCHLQLINVQSI